MKYFIIGFKAILNTLIKLIKILIIGLCTLITILPKYLILGVKFIFQKDKKSSESKEINSKLIPTITITLSIVTYLISIFILTRWYIQNERTKNFTKDFIALPPIEVKKDTPDQYKDLTKVIPAPENNNTYEANTNFININLNYYSQKNPETVAWIQVNGTRVNYPVVQHNDNQFYLKHDFYQRETINGWIFGDYRNNFEKFNNNTIIYGHNLINGTMFGSIPNMINKSWFSNPNNHYIKLSSKTDNSIWQIFSVYTIEPTTDYLQANFNSVTAYQEFLRTITDRSSYNFDIKTNYTDKIITLSTCDNIGTKRVVVHAKLTNIESK